MEGVPLPRFEPMLASPARRRDLTGGGWRFEPKLDGWQALVYVAGTIKVRSRTGRDITGSVPELAGLADRLDGRDAVLDGELVAGAGRAWDFYRLGPRMATNPVRQPSTTTFVAFDVPWLDGVSVCRRPYLERRALLESLGMTGPHLATVETFDCDPADLLAACADLGLEGVVAKRTTSIYRPGQRSPA